MSRNNDYSKKILKILAENKAVSFPDLSDKLIKDTTETAENDPKKAQYALNRSLRGLHESGLVESHFSGQNDYARLTKAGKRKAVSIQLESDSTLVPN